MLNSSGKSSAPHPLHREADFTLLAEREFADWWLYLGSFWPYHTHSYESRLAKAFKESLPSVDFQPHIATLCDFYAKAIIEKLPDRRVDFIVRALSSSETTPDQSRPQGLLVRRLCELTKAYDVSEVFFRSQPRTSMRMVENLSGSAALRQRLKYAAQDLFVKPKTLKGRVLFFDDIANTGATMRVYSWALKEILGANEVWCANLSLTRFGAGKDGMGHLEIDTSQLVTKPGFNPIYKDQKNIFHSSDSCMFIDGKTAVAPMFFALRRLQKCPHCRFGS